MATTSLPPGPPPPSATSIWSPGDIFSQLPDLTKRHDVGKALCFIHCNGPVPLRDWLIFLCGLGITARPHWINRYNFWGAIAIINGHIDVEPFLKNSQDFKDWVKDNCKCDCHHTLTATQIAAVTYNGNDK